MNRQIKIRVIVAATALALTGVQAEAAKNKDKYKDVVVYGNITLEQDSMHEWGPWEQFIQPAAGTPIPPPVAASIPDPIPEIRKPEPPVPPEPPIESFCEPGAACGYASYRYGNNGSRYEPSDYTRKGSPTNSGGGAPAKLGLEMDMASGEASSSASYQTTASYQSEGDPVTASFQVATTKDRDDYSPDLDNYSPVNSVDMNGNYYDGSIPHNFIASGNDYDEGGNGQQSYIDGYKQRSPTTYAGYWSDGAEGGYGDDVDNNEWNESRYGYYVYGITTSQEGLDELHAGNVEAYYEGNTLTSDTPVSLTVNFGNSTWSGTWNKGVDGVIDSTGTDSHGVHYVYGDIGFHASGDIVGVNLTADTITADDGIIDQNLSTVEMSTFGNFAETIGGVHDITKTVTEETLAAIEKEGVIYDAARNVDVIVVNFVDPPKDIEPEIELQ